MNDTLVSMALMACLAATLVFSAVAQQPCKCGPYTYPDPSSPGTPPTPYTKGVDYPGNDMDPCGSDGCVLSLTSTYVDCEAKCNSTEGCNGYVFSEAGCDVTKKGNVCWLKSAFGAKVPNNCRNSRILHGTRKGPFCAQTSKWASQVDPNNTTPLPDYPRPQMTRADKTWINLNGLWDFLPASGPASGSLPSATKFNQTVNVPFPVESCLSGIWKNYEYMWYRRTIKGPFSSGRTLLHFGAVDWNTTVWVGGKLVGCNIGGYNGFSLDVTDALSADSDTEIIVFVHDPSDYGTQPFGKQRVSAIDSPGGDTYTPASGIWQTVWLENVPESYITGLKMAADLNQLTISVNCSGSSSSDVSITVLDGSSTVASAKASCNASTSISIPNPKLWSTTSPFLYNLSISYGDDAVGSYFGMRTFTLGKDANGTTRPMLNGEFIFLAGWLDQSFWPDGIYTAPTDEALAFDVLSLHTFGMNFARLHQKVNPERWYYHADRLGIVIFQDMVQHYGDAHGITPSSDYYYDDLAKMIEGRYNHPCIVQWTAFNEGDMVKHFDPKQAISFIRSLDPTRLVDTDSGGPANDLHIGDVNDIHTYPYPGDPKPRDTQYAMIGEFGGIGAFVPGKEWWPNACHTYLHVDTPHDEASKYIDMANTVLSRRDHISVTVYTQIADVELECDGFLNYDRTNKFSANDTSAIALANQQLINGN